MNKPGQSQNAPVTPEKETKDKSLVGEAEAAAAQDEPMGSIAAAVPGNDDAAENALEPGQKPGAEDTGVRKEKGPTAGTEFPAAPKGPNGSKNAA